MSSSSLTFLQITGKLSRISILKKSESVSKRDVHIVSTFGGSIGEISKDLTEALKQEFNITIEGESKPANYDILLCHFINPGVVRDSLFTSFKHKVLIQPIDGTIIHEEYITLMNQFDLIITPAEAGKRIMKANGVTVPIVVVPNYFKGASLYPSVTCKIKQIPKGKYVFYHESTLHARKGIEYLYEGYIRAFSDTEYTNDVVLVIKDLPFNPLTFDRIETLKRKMIELQKQYKNPARIIKISQYLKTETLEQLWSRADAYVSLAKIEGFGIPLLRFAFLRKPIIALNNSNSGYLDFLNDNNSYLIPTTQIVAENEHIPIYTKETQWGIPKVNDVSKTMLKCYIDSKTSNSKFVHWGGISLMGYNIVMKKYVDLLKQFD